MPIFEWGEWLRVETEEGVALSIEPHVALDEFSSALWWTVELVDLKKQRLVVVLAHPEGRGRFELTQN